LSIELSYFKYDYKGFHDDLVGGIHTTSKGYNRKDNPFFDSPILEY
jgi:hypothetical protein